MSLPLAAPTREGSRATRNPALPATWAVVAGIVALVILQHGASWNAPFFSDDYMLLDKVRGASPVSLVAPGTLAYHYYRPWSRELYHAAMLSLFGPWPPAFHLACFALYVATLALYFTYVRRLAGTGAAGVATAFLASLAAWGVLVEWSSGAQDLWMMVWALLALHAFARGRDGLATVMFALALLSKETAVAIPAIAFVSAWWVAGASPATAARRVAPMLGVLVVWAIWHPALGGALWWARDLPASPKVATNPIAAGLRSVLSLANLDIVPRPEAGWLPALAASAPAVALLSALVVFSTLRSRDDSGVLGARARRTIGLGLAWTAFAWIPLALPSLIWQSYYTLFGAMGAALALGVALRRHPRVAVAVIVAVALLQGPRAHTRTPEWGNQRDMVAGSTFMGLTERWLKQHHPRLPHHARLYFADVPRRVVFVLGPGDTPAVRVWYRDPTLSGSYWSQYRLRAPGEPSGPDLFFRHDSTLGWVEVETGAESLATVARPATWRVDHENLAYVLVDAGNVGGALVEYEKLARHDPRRPDYAFMAGLCAETLGDSSRASRWFQTAAADPKADDEMRAKARDFAPRRGLERRP